MRSIFSSRVLLSVVCAVCVLIAAGVALASFKGSAQDQPPKVVNLTDAFKVESFTKVESASNAKEKAYVLTLKNISKRKLVAWLVKGPDGTSVASGLSAGSASLEPNELYEVTVYDRGADNPSGNQVTVALAMFEDGGSEGDFKDHKLVADNRIASKLQIQRVNEILEKALLSRRQEQERGKSSRSGKQWIEEMMSQVASLPGFASPDQPDAGMALNAVKEGALWNLKTLLQFEEERAAGSPKAREVLKQQGFMLNAKDVEDGIAKIIDKNEKALGKSAKGGLNEK